MNKKDKYIQGLKDKVFECVMKYFDYGMDDHPLRSRQEKASKIRKECMDELCWRWQDYNTIQYDSEDTWDLNFNDYE